MKNILVSSLFRRLCNSEKYQEITINMEGRKEARKQLQAIINKFLEGWKMSSYRKILFTLCIQESNSIVWKSFVRHELVFISIIPGATSCNADQFTWKHVQNSLFYDEFSHRVQFSNENGNFHIWRKLIILQSCWKVKFFTLGKIILEWKPEHTKVKK